MLIKNLNNAGFEIEIAKTSFVVTAKDLKFGIIGSFSTEYEISEITSLLSVSKYKIDPFDVAVYTLFFLISKALIFISELIKTGSISTLKITMSL